MSWVWRAVKICGFTSQRDISTWPVQTPRVVLSGFRRWYSSFLSNNIANPNSIGFLNSTGRGLTDRVAVLDTRGPGRLASRIKWITAENFPGIQGDGTFNLHGFDVLVDKNTDILRILLINHRPPFDPVTGEPLDAMKVGANSTIELFQTKAGSDTMRYIRTYANDVILTPNRVQWVSDHSFVFSNDKSSKVGFVSSFILLKTQDL